MRYDPVDAAFFSGNRERLAELLPPGGLAVLLANDIYPTNADGVMPFKQNANLYYLSGIDQEETALLLFPAAVAEADREILFVRETSEHLRVWEGKKLTLEQASARSGVATVKTMADFRATLQRLAMQADCLCLDANEHPRADNPVPTRGDRFIRECQERFPLHRLERLAPLLARLRAYKAPEEIAMLREAIAITEVGYQRVFGFIEPGVGEWEIEAEFAHEFLRRRSRGFAYTPIVASGANALGLHYIDNTARCADGELVLMDIGAEWGHWNADLTRTVPVSGRFTPRQRAVYDAVLRAFHFAGQSLRPGKLVADYTEEVRAFMGEELAGLGLLSADDLKGRTPEKDPVKKYFMHGVSHPLGLDVHDVFPPDEPIAPGMVFTIEPGIYIREEGLGIRLENDFLVGETANIDLCDGIPLTADEIEAAMQR